MIQREIHGLNEITSKQKLKIRPVVNDDYSELPQVFLERILK